VRVYSRLALRLGVVFSVSGRVRVGVQS
jgi:hypothetical protein